MAIDRIKPGGWGYKTKLSSTEINDLDVRGTHAVDKRAGQSDEVGSDLIFTGSVDFQTELVARDGVQVGGDLAVSGRLVLNGSVVRFNVDPSTTFSLWRGAYASTIVETAFGESPYQEYNFALEQRTTSGSNRRIQPIYGLGKFLGAARIKAIRIPYRLSNNLVVPLDDDRAGVFLARVDKVTRTWTKLASFKFQYVSLDPQVAGSHVERAIDAHLYEYFVVYEPEKGAAATVGNVISGIWFDIDHVTELDLSK